METASANALDQLDPRDREYVTSLDGAEREVVLSTLLRYRRSTALAPGAALPDLEIVRLADGGRVALRDLLRGRPLTLVFGSFT